MELIACAILYTVRGVTYLSCAAYVMGGPDPAKAATLRAVGELRKKHGKDFKLKRVQPTIIEKTYIGMVLKPSVTKLEGQLPVVDDRATIAAGLEQQQQDMFGG